MSSHRSKRFRMENRPKAAKDIDEYIAGYPEDVQQILEKIRATIKAAAPEAVEAISYGIPCFRYKGNLIFFAGFRTHVSVYPAPRGSEAFKAELSAYKGGKGTVQFPLGKPVPYELISRMTAFRMQENLAIAEAKARKS